MPDFYYVYCLISVSDPDRHYIGSTTDLHARFETHNLGEVIHTANYTPWRIDSANAFAYKKNLQRSRIT